MRARVNYISTHTRLYILIYPIDTIHTSGKAVINNVPVSARPSGAHPLLGPTTDVFYLAQPAAETWQNPAVFDQQNDPATRRSEKDWSGGMPRPGDSVARAPLPNSPGVRGQDVPPDQMSPRTRDPRTRCPPGHVVLGPDVPRQDRMSPLPLPQTHVSLASVQT